MAVYLFKVFQPEGVVGLKEVVALIAAVTMHAVRVDHELEFLTCAMKGIQELECILVMNIVIACAMGQFQHDRLDILIRR